jgi:hypothetical protein
MHNALKVGEKYTSWPLTTAKNTMCWIGWCRHGRHLYPYRGRGGRGGDGAPVENLPARP